VDAAWRCLETQTFPEVTVDDICIAAGVSKGAFYGYFPSKRALLHELIAQDSAALDGVMARLGAQAMPAGQRLRHFAHACLRDAEHVARMQLRTDVWASLGGDPEIASALRESARNRRAVMRGWIEQGVAAGELSATPANALASILLAVTDGLAIHHALDPTAFKWRNVRAAVDALISGIEAT
jgi:AcrR family transcriptional regulator